MKQPVTFDGLAWFRRRQRKLARGVLAVFCLAWLQVATLPCVMGSVMASSPQPTVAQVFHSATTTAASGMQQTMPAMGAGEHCPYCPADITPQSSTGSHANCAFPHDPQVDARAGLALGMALPAVAPVLILALAEHDDRVFGLLAPPATVPKYALAVHYCRFLK